MKLREIVIVDADVFEAPNAPERPRYPVELCPCYCDPQDGQTCERHRSLPVYEYGIRDRFERWHHIRPGEWYVRYSDGRLIVLPKSEIDARFEECQPEPGGPR